MDQTYFWTWHKLKLNKSVEHDESDDCAPFVMALDVDGMILPTITYF